MSDTCSIVVFPDDVAFGRIVLGAVIRQKRTPIGQHEGELCPPGLAFKYFGRLRNPERQNCVESI